ncbi:DUF4159 domain-containing protein [Pedobacter cryophilus]|uniref:DUF4159 domain-containing protein n=1 Tax=Pedobacter cryophilus TaxID=2571271 RepID=A0A4U1BX47_9SPHI|nr:DUF4159 domain-containing protein [Pedobacter cryophilus]TKB95776.1 DUF4159 domain-containing protein [Pedobacter cryophilus]
MLRNQLFKPIEDLKGERFKLKVKSRNWKVKETSFLIVFFCLCSLFFVLSFKSVETYKIAKLKYNGGGDWYANRTALPNLIDFCNQNLGTRIAKEETVVEVGSADLFNYPFVYLTGHGNVVFSDQEAKNLRQYLIGGGFLHIDDNYGLDKFIRPQMKKVFPELDFIELSPQHAIFNQKFKFPAGLPKIHEHDGKRPQAFALTYKGKVVCFYTFECDLGNGWEDFGTYPEDTPQSREKALKMGANLLQFALTQ